MPVHVRRRPCTVQQVVIRTVESSMCGGDAAFCQITLTTCYYYHYYYYYYYYQQF